MSAAEAVEGNASQGGDQTLELAIHDDLWRGAAIAAEGMIAARHSNGNRNDIQ
jgi:hypothetical protein